MRPWGTWGSRAEDLSVIQTPPPLPFCLLFIRPMEIRVQSAGGGDDVVINPEVANGALAFHLNKYLHLNRHDEGAPSPWGGGRRCPEGFTQR